MSESALQFIGSEQFATPNTAADLDVIFIHGLGGDLNTSWSASGDHQDYWPQWITADLPSTNIWAVGYDSGTFTSLLSGSGSTVRDTASTVLDLLSTRGIGERPIAFVTHSLGGIVVKQVLRLCSDQAVPKYKSILQNTRCVIFLGTPHQGAKLAASICSILGKFTTAHVDELAHGQDSLIDLSDWFSNWAVENSVAVASFYETKKTFGTLLVDKITENPNVHGCTHVAVATDHIEICKPSNRDAQVYTSALSMLSAALQSHLNRRVALELIDVAPAPNGLAPSQSVSSLSTDGFLRGINGLPAQSQDAGSVFSIEDLPDELQSDYEHYTTIAPDDRRSLKVKLEDANRQYEVRLAEQKKERFAKALYRHVAQPSAIVRYTHLLSDVESRFNRIVYPLIVGGASPNEINERIQIDVVDAVVAGQPANAIEITKALVEGALYFLTGNCHVRWDNAET